MLYDYLNKYKEQYGDGGFRRFYKEGFVNENHNYNYAPTVTAPGHNKQSQAPLLPERKTMQKLGKIL